MGVNVNLVYQSVQALILKEMGTGFMTPATYNTLSNMAVVEFVNKYAEVYQATQHITDKIRPMIKSSRLAVDQYGKMLYPDDYVMKVAVRAYDPDSVAAAQAVCTDDMPIDWKSITQINVDTIDNGQLGYRLSSEILKPDRYVPIITFYDDYIQWYPIDVGSGFLEYLSQPDEVVWAYTVGTNGLPQYDAANSTDFPFNWLMQNEIIIKICSYFGLSIREEQLMQGADALEAKQM